MSRQTESCEWLIGRHAVIAALQARHRRFEQLWLRQGSDERGQGEIRRAAAGCGVDVEVVTADKMRATTGETPAVALRCSPFPYRGEVELPPADPCGSLVVVLDGIQDPQNLGAIARTAEAAGACALLIPDRRAAAVTPAAVRASAGATEYLPIYRVVNIARALDTLKKLGYWTVGLAPGGAEGWSEPDYRGGVALVVGAEGAGLRRLVLDRCDHVVWLSMRGRVESLNASAAFAAVAYEVVRQQTRK